MLEDNEYLFDEFKKLHETYSEEDPEENDEFHEVGRKVLRVVRRYENELCSKSENSKFGKFSENLSEKFWEQVRAYFPRIDSVELA